MARIYPVVNGMVLEKYMAHNPRAQAALRTHAHQSKVRGNRLLAEHTHAGHSYVTASRANDIDWQVSLHDPSGVDPQGKYPVSQGAMSIEFGREPGTKSPYGPMKGLYILHRAVGSRTAFRRYKRIQLKIKVPGARRGFKKFV